jgi:hypothetical protein
MFLAALNLFIEEGDRKLAPFRKVMPDISFLYPGGAQVAERKKAVSKKTSARKSSKKSSAGRKSSAANGCWPGYEPTPGKKQGEKGSCKPKAKQTAAEKKGDQKAAAASRLSGQRA